ncbi:unnamed protein product [Symbiodinium natans]|uniref:Uncharacterized protein n=1 Tax=Symbiodinium natans TaxID=878477 RepID=A0A812LEM1_9DINO|nr:unnamed protein product [Symbiodinium natans]
MKPILAEGLARCSKTRPLRVVDLGSCSGFFALKAAYRHPEADVVAIEGSVGIGNGSVGMQGTVRQILKTDAVQMHLRWIQRLKLTNCFLAPEVWDYLHVCNLAKTKRPICDFMFMLSVVHHIDNVSVQQYARVGMTRVQGGIDLLAKLLTLAPRHFVELPNEPWMKELFEKYGTSRGILEAAADATGLKWSLRGPIFTAEWFGSRDTWVLEVQDEMAELDIQCCPFPLLYRGNEVDAAVDVAETEQTSPFQQVEGWNFPGDNLPLSMKLAGDSDVAGMGGMPAMGGHLANPHLGAVASCENLSGLLLDPGLYASAAGASSYASYAKVAPEAEPRAPAGVAAALKAAPTALLLAHLTLREAVAEAEDALADVRRAATQLPEPVGETKQ